MNPSETLGRLRSAGVVAVIRGPSAEGAVSAAKALIEGGVTGIEITYSTPDAARAIASVSGVVDDRVVLGAGTVTNAEQAKAAAAAGATFIVTPGTNEALASAVLETGVAGIFGALTPSEVLQVVAWGAHAVKIFPASLGGPSYLRALRAPMPDLSLMPTGGVSADNLADWFAAGASCVGAGSELCSAKLISDQAWSEIEQRARRYAEALASARA